MCVLNLSPLSLPLQSTVYISTADMDRGTVLLRNGSAESISLAGWVLKSFKTKQEFKLPDVDLAPSAFASSASVLACC